LIRKRPLLSVVFVPSTPMNDDSDCTGRIGQDQLAEFLLAGAPSRRTRSTASFGNPWIKPVSCTGKKPFG
jgi:hypothetical protein